MRDLVFEPIPEKLFSTRVERCRPGTRPWLGLPIAILGLCLVLAGCMEDTINNQLVSPTGSIYGRVTPVETGTEVAAWQATKVKSVIADAGGFFTITDLQPGLYDVIVTAPSGAHRQIHDVEVNFHTSLGSIALANLPYPLLSFSPSDGASDVPLGQVAVSLLSEEELDLTSLATAVQITPPIAGTWIPNYYPAAAYQYILQGPGQTSTTYEVHIGPGLKLESGSEWGATLDFSFTTTGLALLGNSWSIGGPLPPLFRDRLASLQFNMEVDPGSVAQAVHTVPPVELLVVRSPYSWNYVDVSIVGDLLPSTQYELQIDTTLRDTSGHALTRAVTLPFSTQRFQVTGTRFSSSSYQDQFDPGGELYANVYFNAHVDVEAFNGAASFEPAIPGIWIESSSSYQNGETLEFIPTGEVTLLPEQTYRFRIDGTTPLAGSVALGSDFVKSFTVDPVKVTSMNPNNGARGVSVYWSVSMGFNTPMDQALTEAAFQLTLQGGSAVSGTFSWQGDRVLIFQPSSYLLAGRSYVLAISTQAASQSGQRLRTAASSLFRTQ